MNKTFVIGDIHGGHKALLQVLEKSNFDFETDTLISVGDIADGWSEVPQCVETLLKIKNLIALRGNHDVWLRDWLKSGYINPMWLMQGGQASYDAYIKSGLVTDQRHKDFFENQLDYFIDEKNRLFVHAGWDYNISPHFHLAGLDPVNGGKPGDNIAKECHWDRELYTSLRSYVLDKLPKRLQEALNNYKEIYIGHTATQFPFEVFHRANLYNVDTGGGWHGKLTMMDIDTKETYQSDIVKTLYPNEKGR